MSRKKRKRRGAARPTPNSAAGSEANTPQATRSMARYGQRLAAGALGALAIGAIIAFLVLVEKMGTPSASSETGWPAAQYVGAETCARCHAKEYETWRGSHHAAAMQEANERTVLGDFASAKLAHAGVTSTFFRRDGRFYVNTEGPDGKHHDYPVKYTFGIAPLQQYLIEFPGGRLQALTIAWDTRPKARGGQRWFHLYPDEKIDHRDALHWTRLNQNWNWMCAECHSTNLRRNYDPSADRYATSWSEINVACEACHGPGSNHVAWAGQISGRQPADADMGLAVRLDERKGVAWNIDSVSGNARRSRPNDVRREVEACAQCHSRRTAFAGGLDHGGRLLDTHEPALLARGLYYADGQQLDEVYNHGSFLQSRMYAQGVTCSDCHDPHSGKLRASGNAVCAQCHQPAKYDAPAHTLHSGGSEGAECAACHMPVRNYMVIDARHDHSIRIPRPDLSRTFGPPNACNACHRDKTPEWAAAAIERAHGPVRKGFQAFAAALHAGRSGEPGAPAKLTALLQDPAAPAIARATALTEMSAYPGVRLIAAIESGVGDSDPLVRGAALDALMSADPSVRSRFAEPLLDDPVRVVRIKAARASAMLSLDNVAPERRARLERGFAEYVASQQANADRPEAHLNLGIFYSERGDATRAEQAYRTAILRQPDFTPAYVNLADLYRALGREPEAGTLLSAGLKQSPGDGDLLHALGLARAREGKRAEATRLLGEAARSRPDNPRYAFVYAVALHDGGKALQAREVLARALERFPNDRAMLAAAAGYAGESGDRAAALRYARRLAEFAPEDPAAAEPLRALEAH